MPTHRKKTRPEALVNRIAFVAKLLEEALEELETCVNVAGRDWRSAELLLVGCQKNATRAFEAAREAERKIVSETVPIADGLPGPRRR